MSTSAKILTSNDPRARFFFWTLVCFMTLAFFTGGSSRPDVQSLVVLRPAAVVCCGVGLLFFRARDWRNFRRVWIFAVLAVVLTTLYATPMPSGLVHVVQGQQIDDEVRLTANISRFWQPTSVAPILSWNALAALAVPLAVLLLGIQLNKYYRQKLLSVLILFGLTTAIVGFVQAVSPGEGITYIYRITNLSESVGMFANRNHQSLMISILLSALSLYIPIKMLQAKKQNFIILTYTISVLFSLLLLLIGGSRAGLAIGMLSILYGAWVVRIYSNFKVKNNYNMLNYHSLLIFFVLLILIAFLSEYFSRSEAYDRISSMTSNEEVRFRLWTELSVFLLSFFPSGSGIGTFSTVFSLFEKDSNLKYYYINHAHNELMELMLTGGIFFIIAIAYLSFPYVKLVRRSLFMKQRRSNYDFLQSLGVMIISYMLLSSLFDYPFRVPFLSCVFAVCLLWCTKWEELSMSSERSRNAIVLG